MIASIFLNFFKLILSIHNFYQLWYNYGKAGKNLEISTFWYESNTIMPYIYNVGKKYNNSNSKITNGQFYVSYFSNFIFTNHLLVIITSIIA